MGNTFPFSESLNEEERQESLEVKSFIHAIKRVCPGGNTLYPGHAKQRHKRESPDRGPCMKGLEVKQTDWVVFSA